MAGNSIHDLAREFITGDSSAPVDIITFIEAKWGLDTALWPAQKVILKCLYGLELEKNPGVVPVMDMMNEKLLHRFSEKEFLQYLHAEGRCNISEVVPGKVYQELILVCGRRASKSAMTSFISAYELYKLMRMDNPQKHYNIIAGSQIAIVNVAPTEPQALLIYNQIANFVKVAPHLRDRVVSMTQDAGFCLQSDADIRMDKKTGTIFCIPGGSSAKSVRGNNSIIVIFDEFAFFSTNGGRFSDEAIYSALTPSTAGFGGDGKKIILSSPDNTSSYFYELYEDSLKHPEDSLMFKMYSALINTTNLKTSELKAARRKDKNKFLREYGGEFMASVSSWVDDPDLLKACISDRKPADRGFTGIKYYYGIDLGFKNDGSAIAVVHKDAVTGKIVLDHVQGYYAGSSDVWDMDRSIYESCNKYAGRERLQLADIAGEVKALVPWFPPRKGRFDHHNGVGFEEMLRGMGIGNFESEQQTDAKNSESYNLVKRLYSEGMLDLFNYEPLIQEMLLLEAEVSKNKTKVRAPYARGCHDDISDAVVKAIHLAYIDGVERPPATTRGFKGYNSLSGRGRTPANVSRERSDTRSSRRVIARLKRGGRY